MELRNKEAVMKYIRSQVLISESLEGPSYLTAEAASSLNLW